MPTVPDRRSLKREREQIIECENQTKDVQTKLQSQLKCLEEKLENQTAMVNEFQDYFKRRSEIEAEYSQKLERLAKHYVTKQKQEKQKREPWAIFSTHKCWQHLLGITRQQSKDHAVLADVYNTAMGQRMSEIIEDSRRIFGKCRDVALCCHDELIKVLNELQMEMKQYQVCHGLSKQAESKLKRTEELKLKVEQQANKASKKLKTLEKQREKRQERYMENKVQALKARNEYLLAIDASNSATHKYFVDDLSLLIDCMDFGYHNALQRSMLLYNSCLENVKTSHQNSIDCIVKCVQELDPNKDKQNFLKANSSIFTLPKKFEYMPHRGDEITNVSAQKTVQDDLLHRYQQLNNRLDDLKLKNEETWKSVEAVDRHLIGLINVTDYDVTELFRTEKQYAKPAELIEQRKRRIESEKYYFEKFREYLTDSNLVSRLQAKHSTLKLALGEDASNSAGGVHSRPPSLPPKSSKPRRIGKSPIVGRPVVFGCNLDEYVEATGEAIPVIVRSCVRAINLYGMHHEGLFRVSGLQAEINEIKASFEKGEDPLSEVADSTSINSIAGVLKLFFRELQEPLFPLTLFDALVEASRMSPDSDACQRIRELIHTLSPARVIVMRYLFAFLNHVSQYSDENLMYPYNLAICFGPTLLPIPNDKDQVMYQNNVNDLIKLVIVNCDTIFPKDEPGPVYERILLDPGDRDEADGSENEHSDDDADVFEATAGYDFEGRSDKELSFKKGDTLLLYNQVSKDWWEGAHNGKEGLIPDQYVHIKRDDVSTPSTPSSSLPASSFSGSMLTEPHSPKMRPDLVKRRSVDSQLTSSCSKSSGSLADSWDKSTSHPNINLDEQKATEVDRLPPTEEISSSLELLDVPQDGLSSALSKESLTDKLEGPLVEHPPPLSKKPAPKLRFMGRKVEKITEFSDEVKTYMGSVDEEEKHEEDEAEKTNQTVEDNDQSDEMVTSTDSTDRMNEDIDQALAEVMSNLETLTAKSSENILQEDDAFEPSLSSPPPKRCTPDLVQDLPLVTNDTSPIGSYKETVHVDTMISTHTDDDDLQVESAAETFANSDGTIVRIKSSTGSTSSSGPRSPTNIKFIGTSVSTRKELSSFKRSVSTSSASTKEDEASSKEEATKDFHPKTRVATITNKAIQVKAPSIPSGLNAEPKPVRPSWRLKPQEDVMSKSMPSTPAVEKSSSFSKADSKVVTKPKTTDTPPPLPEPFVGETPETLPASQLTSMFEKKFNKPPPPIKNKPKPPPPPPKPKK